MIESQWSQHRRQSGGRLDSPFLSLQFAEAVDRARGDVWVAVIGDFNNQPSGLPARPTGATRSFFPFHRLDPSPWGTRRIAPVGRFLNDAQAVIGPADALPWDQLARSMDVTIDLHAALATEPSVAVAHELRAVGAYKSQWSDCSTCYLRRLRKSHRTIAKQDQKTRKLAREIGPLRLEIDCRDEAVAQRLIAMKRFQYKRTHILDHFAPVWTRRLMFELASGPGNTDLSATPMRRLVSVLWAGDRLIAGHLGLIESGRMHYWFPVYDPELAMYSPGTGLYVELLAAASDHGIGSIDMGYGDQPYKRKQTTATSKLFSGRITHCPVDRWLSRVARTSQSIGRRLPWRPMLKRFARTIVPQFGISKLQ